MVLRDALERLLNDAGHDVVGTAGDGPELVRQARAERPDLVIADVRMPPSQRDEDLRAAHEIRARAPASAILVLSHHLWVRYAVELLRAGARGLDHGVLDLLALIAQGRTDASIAAEMTLAESEVARRAASAFAALGLPLTGEGHTRERARPPRGAEGSGPVAAGDLSAPREGVNGQRREICSDPVAKLPCRYVRGLFRSIPTLKRPTGSSDWGAIGRAIPSQKRPTRRLAAVSGSRSIPRLKRPQYGVLTVRASRGLFETSPTTDLVGSISITSTKTLWTSRALAEASRARPGRCWSESNGSLHIHRRWGAAAAGLVEGTVRTVLATATAALPHHPRRRRAWGWDYPAAFDRAARR